MNARMPSQVKTKVLAGAGLRRGNSNDIVKSSEYHNLSIVHNAFETEADRCKMTICLGVSEIRLL